ncbi:molybdate-binding protein [Brachybacterium phenoliresistens]|uniref:Molybdate-binding protein n=1 Tax=Brachybacterium phenoliresistens TaxID=396014 RepID=Z9JS54_9MICO|nr:molybdate ABC transporter substrate-binding protein [Brachybacterium phenoliresistens]EWS80567.1 molybdate-binding protein [Brachybacterium phenoliresistens]
MRSRALDASPARPSRRRGLRRLLGAAGVIALALGAAACAGPRGTAGDAGHSTLTVFAAASLTDVFEQVNADFEADHPGVRVVMTNAGSSDLVTQIDQGAPADVLATADERTMARAQELGLTAEDPRPFATNTLTIAVAPGNPRGITSLADLTDPDLAVVRCAAPVPCGAVADEVLADAGIPLVAVSEENSVTDVLGKVTSGQADAGLVYATDVARSGGAAEAVTIPGAAAHATVYPIAVTDRAEDPELAAAYREAVLGPEGRAALGDAGFGPP